MKTAIIGCGNLGMAMAHGLLQNNAFDPADLTITRRNIELLNGLKQDGAIVTRDNKTATRNADLLVLAVKPYNIENILNEIREEINPDRHILISVATGISIDDIQKWVQKSLPVYRAMPNIAADIKESITCICQKDGSPDKDRQVEELFDSFGVNIHIDENLMEAATILGACGIAYVLRFIRAMIQGGIQIGFDARTANAIVNQTVKGAAQLLISKNEHPEMEIDKVTTPKGCTIVGLNEMEHQGFSSSLIRGIVASFEKIEQ